MYHSRKNLANHDNFVARKYLIPELEMALKFQVDHDDCNTPALPHPKHKTEYY
jgi:hypothetical protein